MRSSKEPSRFFTVEAVALQNLPQTFRREGASRPSGAGGGALQKGLSA